jgi:hypothetical protein
VKDTSSLQATSLQDFTSSTSSLLSLSSSLSSSNDSILSMIGNKRKAVSEEFSSLSCTYSETAKKVCYGISSLQSSSDKILADVTATTEKMNSSTSSDLSTFSSFLSANGADLSKEINMHFKGIKEEYTKEEGIMKDLVSEVSSYSHEMKDTMIEKTGLTPRKQQPFQANKIKETRDYDKIKADSKGSLVLKDISYEMIHEALPKYQQSNTNAVSQEMEVVDNTYNSSSVSVASSSFEKPPLSRCPSNESMKSTSSSSTGSSDNSVDDSENSNPNVALSAPITVNGKESGIPNSAGGGASKSRMTRSSSKGRSGISGISTRQRSGSSVSVPAVTTVDPSMELEYN